MHIYHLFEQKKCVFSIEIFPPKKDGALATSLFPLLREMQQLQPDFMSVTYGAGGSATNNSTCEIASFLKNELQIEPLAHLTCIHSTHEQVNAVLDTLKQHDIQNVLALRGDNNPELQSPSEFGYASDLVQLIKCSGDFNVVGACYPEGHVESENLRIDVERMRYKIEAGVSHLITQLFFDNGCYFRLLNMARKAGYTLPIQAGVMPIVNTRQVQRTVALSSASLPPKFTKMLSKYDANAEALFDAGIDYAIEQMRDLIIGGADGVHLYAMNNPVVAKRIYDGICDLLPSKGDTICK